MIAGGNWWRANEIIIRHLTRQTATHYRSRDKAGRSMGAGKPTRMALRNASQSRTAQCATTPKDRSNLAGALRAFDLHKASYREPRRAPPKGEHDGRPRLGRAWV